MPQTTKENSERARAIRKLINKWRTSHETRSKAVLITERIAKSKPGSAASAKKL